MSECKVYRREIEEAAEGGVMSARGRAHLSACRACGDELRGRESLRALVGGLGKVAAPDDFEFRLRARMAAAKSAGGTGGFSGTRWLYGFAPVAVAACFVVISATLYFRQASRPRTAAPPAAVAAGPARGVETAPVPSSDAQSRPAEPSDEAKEVGRASGSAAGSPKTHKPARRVNARAAQAREVASNVERRADVAPNTLIGSVTGAQVIRPIRLDAPSEPLRVILMDERGAERVVQMRSVSFGSQSFLSRDAATRPPVAAEVGGVW